MSGIEKLLDKNGNLSSVKIRFLNNNEKNKICELGNSENLNEACYKILHSIIETPKCIVCNTNNKKFKNFKIGYSDYCGGSCATKASVKSGKESHLSDPIIRNKIKNTLIKKYGVDNPNKLESVKTSKAKTCLERYGSSTWLGSNEFLKNKGTYNRDKTRTKNAKKTLIDNWLTKRLAEIKEIATPEFSKWEGSLTPHKFKCVNCDKVFNGFLRDGLDPRCTYCFPKSISSVQQKVMDILDTLGIHYEVNNRSILNGKEIDIYIPEKSLGFEINGNYWHSKLDKNYHLEKSKLASKYGVNLIHLFEDEVLYRNIEFFIRSIFDEKDYDLVFSKSSNITLIENSLQNIKSYDFGYSACSDEYTVGTLMVLKEQNNYIIQNYCAINNGVLGRLIENFIIVHDFQELSIIVDRRFNFNVESFSYLGFKLEQVIEPKCWYLNGRNRQETLIENAPTVYDCGYSKWTLKKC